MAWESFGIEHYEVRMVTHGTAGYPGIYAYIRLHWLNRERATLWFHRDGSGAIPGNVSSTSGGVVTYYARFGQSEFADAIDLLRNEKPVSFQWNTSTKGAMIGTGKEPVGDNEAP